MRIRLAPTAAAQVAQFGKRTGRSASSAAALLISKTFLDWGAATPLPEIEGHVIEHGNGVTISARVRGDLSEALRRYAADEHRSLSSIMKRVLRQKLAELGYMPARQTSDRADAAN